MTTDNKDLKSYLPAELESLAEKIGFKRYLGRYLFSFIHNKNVSGIENITPLPKTLRQSLEKAGFFISQVKLIEEFIDPDGTVKFLLELADGRRIESVLLTDARRKTLCISSQVGCRMACVFCATGKLSFGRNMTAGEIADQVNAAETAKGKIHNVVYMGMGEPFDNYNEVIRSIRILNDPAGRNIGQRRITISTCGIPDGIIALADEDMQIRLAISLNAVTNDIRSRIMAVGRKYSIEEIIRAVKTYQQKTTRRVTFEHCMIKSINDSTADASAIVKLISGIKANINLIEYNPHAGCDFAGSSRDRIENFAGVLRSAGIETNIRYRRGRKIKAACGQLGADRS